MEVKINVIEIASTLAHMAMLNEILHPLYDGNTITNDEDAWTFKEWLIKELKNNYE